MKLNIKLTAFLTTVVVVQIYLSPFTKVEESFNIQAIHDHLIYTPRNISKYDHFEFPGVVPRTFIGNLLLSLPLQFLKNYTSLFNLQYASRFLLGFINVITTQLVFNQVSDAFNQNAVIWMTLLTASQFHFTFWCSRALPNLFALPLVNISTFYSIRASIDRQNKSKYGIISLSTLTIAAVIFRLELILLIAPLSFQLWFNKCISLKNIIVIGVLSALTALTATISIDSYFWDQRFLWPEFNAFVFNIFQDKAKDWGVSPWRTYFLNYLPKILLTALPLSYIAILPKSDILPNETVSTSKVIVVKENDSKTQVTKAPFQPLSLLFPSLFYIFILSFIGHKEWRFIIYVIPVFNSIAGLAMARLWDLRNSKILTTKSLMIIPICALCLNLLITSFMTAVSSRNYPGGYALQEFHEIVSNDQPSAIHLDTLTAMTGATRFGELFRNNGWTYLKNEDHIPLEAEWRIAENVEAGWNVVRPIKGLKSFRLKSLEVEIGDVLYIQQRISQ
ncbi:hypothetical protein E3Q17_02199 [Wallemia mellicola]|uniref:Mannosyltransferase n=1 Tax=Wallemia mellicola TaxID=1708541 RepID=A0A4T0QL43_9BASI|nr:hypothetical protein E3Q21_01303 [Wallemia mellicola]TIB90281.1 hypothetical protein E3Q20_01290 [Wallemia mellicola]TIC00445.1 hypothetical protein E3Q17_02199 [Wallemia mellicola]TIC06320.1 hypothetical protein E3Q16_01249 [Wallemia mellicola]TIC24594.1 hypothetical protein E3Q12_01391 [Wallemia mellicola]